MPDGGDVDTGGEDGHRWFEGAVLEDPTLAAAVHGLWRAAAGLAGEADEGLGAPATVGEAQDLLADASTWLVGVLGTDGDDRTGQAGRLLLELTRLSTDLHDASLAQRVRSFSTVQSALGRLRAVGDVEQISKVVVAELAGCGFDRTFFTRVDGGTCRLHAVHVQGDPQEAARLLEAGRAADCELDHTAVETEMVRRRGPLLVGDVPAPGGRRRTVLGHAASRGFVAAPVLPDGRLVGFLHADCDRRRRLVGEHDRDVLWHFAEGFSSAYERATLLERLKVLRQEVRRTNRSILTVLDEFCNAEVEVSRIDRENHAVAHSAASIFVGADSRVEQLLTRRELDVIRLMAAGETNAGIATRLVVSEGTVKSHVKHILRKLRASNRAEAVSRFVRLSQ